MLPSDDYRPLSGRRRLLIVLLRWPRGDGVMMLLDPPGGVQRKARCLPTGPCQPGQDRVAAQGPGHVPPPSRSATSAPRAMPARPFGSSSSCLQQQAHLAGAVEEDIARDEGPSGDAARSASWQSGDENGSSLTSRRRRSAVAPQCGSQRHHASAVSAPRRPRNHHLAAETRLPDSVVSRVSSKAPPVRGHAPVGVQVSEPPFFT